SQRREVWNSIEGNERREFLESFGEVEPEFRAAGDEASLGITPQEFEQRIEGRWTEEGFVGRPIFLRHRCRRDFARGAVRRAVIGGRSQRLAGGIADGPVTRATAEIAAKLVVELPRLGEVGAMKRFEQRHDDAGRAITTLRAAMLDQAALDGMQ